MECYLYNQLHKQKVANNPKNEDLPPRRRVDHAIKVMPGVEPPAKAPYRMSHEELKELKVHSKNSSPKVPSNQVSRHMGHPSFLFTRRMGL